jgi:hypothetical protein
MRYYRSLTVPFNEREKPKTASSGMYMFVANMDENNGMSLRYCEMEEITFYLGDVVQ